MDEQQQQDALNRMRELSVPESERPRVGENTPVGCAMMVFCAVLVVGISLLLAYGWQTGMMGP